MGVSENQIFKVNPLPIRAYEDYDRVQIRVSFEMDLNLVRKTWPVYTVLDLLSDVGGLCVAFWVILSILFALIYFNALERYLVT